MQQSRDVAAKNCAAMEVPAAQCRPEAFVSPFSALMPGQSRHADPFSNALRIMPMARPTNSSRVEEDLIELCALTVGSR